MLQGANGLKGEQMIDKFKAKCSEGGKNCSKSDQSKAGKASLARADVELKICPKCK